MILFCNNSVLTYANRSCYKTRKPFRSVLAPYEKEVQDLHAQGMSVRVLAAEMRQRHGVQISHNAVASFLRAHRSAKNFLEGLTETRKGELLKALKAWIRDFNGLYRTKMSQAEALEAYVRAHTSFVRIHPFFDGNGRLTRLLANLPVLFAGFPPIVMPSDSRIDYIAALWKYQRLVGVVSEKSPEFLPRPELLDDFKSLVRQAWDKTLDLVAEARK